MSEGLLERGEELDVLCAAVDDAADRRGSFALVVGEAGIGKSALIRGLLARTGSQVRALVGSCDDLLTPRALGPLRDIARADAPLIATALESADRDAIFPAVLGELDDPLHPVVLVIEDVHWADDATLDVLRYLAPRVSGLPALVVLSYRESEITVEHGLRRVLGALAGTRPHRLALEGFSIDAVTELARDTETDPAELLILTGGNPFFVTEILATPTDAIPASIADAVLARLRQLGPATQAALEQLAVLPWRVDQWLVDRLVPDAGALAEAEARGLVRVDSHGVAFRHELARRAMLEAMPRSQERDHHRRVLDAMLEQGAIDRPRILHHAVAVGDHTTILEFGPAAARVAAAAGAHRQALAHYQHVLEFASRIPEQERAQLHEELAWELYNAHRFSDGATQAGEAVRLRQALGEPIAHGRALVSLSRFQYNSNAPAQAMQSIERAVEILAPHDDLGATQMATIYRGALLQLLDRPDDALPVLEDAVRVTDGRFPALEALARNYLGCARMDLDDPTGVAFVEQSIRDATALDEQELAVRGYANLTEGLAYLHDHDRLRRYVAEGLAYASERDFAAHLHVVEAFHGLLLTLDGRTQEAEEHLRRIVAATLDPGNTGRFSLPLLARLATRHDAPDAREILDRAWANALAGDTVTSLVPGAIAALEYAWTTMDPEAGRAEAVLALDRLAVMPGRARLRGELLRWLRRIGDDAEPGGPVAEPYATALSGDWQTAADRWMHIGDPYEAALELVDSGEEDAARRGLKILDELGAVATARRVRRDFLDAGMRRVPRGPRATTRAHPGGLTARQAEVLELLAQGCTNADIAHRLVISQRTVDHHVAAILQKLGVSTRQEAASFVHDAPA